MITNSGHSICLTVVYNFFGNCNITTIITTIRIGRRIHLISDINLITIDIVVDAVGHEIVGVGVSCGADEKAEQGEGS